VVGKIKKKKKKKTSGCGKFRKGGGASESIDRIASGRKGWEGDLRIHVTNSHEAEKAGGISTTLKKGLCPAKGRNNRFMRGRSSLRG